MKKLSIQPATLKDLDRLNVLMRASKGYWGYDDDFLDKFMSIFGMTENCLRNQTTRLIYLNDELIGYYSFIERENDLELDMLFLEPKYIGKGYGKSCWELCTKTMKQLKYTSFFLIADPNANTYYEKMGCKKIGEKISEMGQGRINTLYRYSTKQ